MNDLNKKEIVESLIDTFLYAGKICLELRDKGLIKKIKSDNTPVSNDDLEVNRLLQKKLKKSHLIYQLFQKKLLIINSLMI